MPYPTRLVPKADDLIVEENALKLEELLCRWVKPGYVLKDSQGNLSAEAVEEKQLFGYSLNKIPPSEIEDIYISFSDTEKFNEAWVPGSDGITPTDQEYTMIKDRTFYLVRIKDIHGLSSAYPYPAEPGAEDNYVFKVGVVHKPLIANIAHFEFDIQFYELNGVDVAEVEPSKKSSSRKIIVADIRQELIRKARFQLKDFAA